MSNTLSNAIKAANQKSRLSQMALLTGTAAFALMGLAAQANAQAPAAEAEEIVVTGIRGALKNAVDIKRNASAVVDSVSAEDVGKLPDSDVAQSLGRIPGVTVGRAFGQGASVSIRGSDPRMTLTSLNGNAVASTGWYDQQAIDRSFNYSMLPSELIAGMDVFKSSQANLGEGGIGGTVVVKTRKPLDLDANTVYGGLKASVGTVSDDVAPEVSGLYSWKNDAESFGILVSAAYSSGDYVRRGTEADVGWGGSAIQPSTFIQERERTALDATLQFKPTDELEFGAHILSMELIGDNLGGNMYISQEDAGWSAAASNCKKTNAAGTCVKSVTPSATPSNTFYQNWVRQGSMDSNTVDLNAAYKTDSFEIAANVGQTKATGGTEMTSNYGYGWWGAGSSLPGWAGEVDATGKTVKLNPSKSMNIAIGDLDDTISASSWTGIKGPNSDEETYAKVDLKFDLDLGAIKAFHTGVRVTDHTFEKESNRAVYKAVQTQSVTSTLYDGTMKLGTEGFTVPKPSISKMIAANLANVDRFVEERAGLGILEESNQALYGMFDFESDGVKGNFGLRYISTEVDVTGYKFDGSAAIAGDIGQNIGWSKARTTESAEYSDVLPSVNVAFDLTDDLVLRVSASQAINRANYENMFLASSAGYQDTRAGNESMTFGSAGLLPMKASQADVGVEYYYGEGNLISLTYFTKDINNFITAETEVNQKIGVVSPDSGLDSWTVNQYVNAGGGTIEGIEFQINHAFDNGFGTSFNFTYANGNAPAASYADNIGSFTESSNTSANIVGYYETEVWSARAAYNWRSEYMMRETGYYGNRMHDDFGSLDLSFGYNVTENIGLSLEVTNLLEEDDVQYGAAKFGDSTVKTTLVEDYPAWSYIGETTVKAGVNVKF